MLYTPTTKRALLLCTTAHAGQTDKSGLPYLLHPVHLAEQMDTEDETCVALLHDTMEDCGLTPDDLRYAGMNEQVVAAIQLLTHQPGVPYLDYVRAIGASPLARRVKIADLLHNSDLSRIGQPTERDLARVEKYRKALDILGYRRYKVITLCGSTRFRAAFEETNKQLTLAGNIVIGVGLYGHAGDGEVWEDADEDTLTATKLMLDDMHKRKIDMADEIFVINVGGYMGSSTRSEIAYAKAHNKPVRYLEPVS